MLDFRIILTSVYIFHSLSSSRAEVEVRLVDGLIPYQGRLEVRQSNEGEWGTVCDDHFDKSDAAVVCRMLGFQNTEHAVNVSGRYGPGLGRILLDEMRCVGNETNLSQCGHDKWGESDCGHNEDIGVHCQTPVKLTEGYATHVGQVNVKVNEEWKTLCFDTFHEGAGMVLCRMMAYSTGNVEISSAIGNTVERFGKMYTCNGTEKDISECSLKETHCNNNNIAEINCRTGVRLSGGPHGQNGRVEVFLQDKWGAVCDNSFDANSASVVCRMLGYNTRDAKAYGRSRYGIGPGEIMVDGLKCLGSETDISECKINIWGSRSNCNRNETASVKCGTNVRLADGPTAFSGRLELRYGGVWQTVCDAGFDTKAATVVCRMLNYEQGNVSVHNGSYYKDGSGAVFHHGWTCTGNETDISDCAYVNLTKPCNQSTEIGINCFSATPIRLVGGPTPFSGRVEVYLPLKSIWTGVCYSTLSKEDASVLCTMFGKPNRNPHVHDARSLYQYVIRGKAIGQLNCNGTERDITDCRSIQPWNETSCSYPNYAGINCDPETQIRLVDGPSEKAGRVEILFNGSWGGVCSSGLSSQETDIMCSMLGYNYMSYILKTNEYTQASDNITISGLNCKGGESDISDCKANIWQTGVCSSSEAVDIACKSKLRLVNGTSQRSGRVEIWHNGNWNTLCADSFDQNVANVTCYMAGFRFWNASVLPDSPFGLGLADVILDNVTCIGDESDIASCQSSSWSKTSCKSKQVASVHCKVQDTPVRLVNGDTPYSGRVEVYHHNKWGTVCERGFSKFDARVICRMLFGNKASTDLTVVIDNYDAGFESNNVMIRGLMCIGNESDISLCPSSDWDSGHSGCSMAYQSVGVNCLTPISLIGGRTKYMGRVRVTHGYRTGAVCSDNFTNENVKIICSVLGFNFTTSYIWQNETYASGAESTMITGLGCNGDEIDIQQCRSKSWNSTHCQANATAFVNCNTPVKLSGGSSWRSGRIEVLQDGKWNEICYSNNQELNKKNGEAVCKILGFSTSNVTMSDEDPSSTIQISLNCSGTEDDISLCKLSPNTCLTNKTLRVTCNTGIKLVYGRTDFMGAVSVYLHGSYGIIPYINDDVTAGVVCRLLGFSFSRETEVQSGSEMRYQSCYYQNMERLICEGNERDIMECKKSYWSPISTYHCGQPSGVNCQTPVRLVNGSSYQYGRVEMKRNGTWYPVCSKGFTLQNAQVVCKMLGHKYTKNTAILNSSTKINYQSFSGNLQCTGNEDDIAQCTTKSIISNCPSGEAVHINCTTSIRLVDGPTPYKGRPEVKINGKWGPVCGYSDSNTHRILCKMLGFNYIGAIAHTGSRYSNKTFTDYAVSDMSCSKNKNNKLDEDITECSSTKWYPNSTCYQHPLELECNSPVSLQGGSNTYIGWVRVTVNNTYKSVCGDNFSEENADVICRKIGISANGTSKIYYGNRFGSTSYTPIEGLDCLGNETDLQECKSVPWTSESNHCSSSNKVAINCRPNTPLRLNGTDKSSGLVQINYFNYWGTICHSNFDVKDASVICNMLGYKIGEVGYPSSTSSDAMVRYLACKGTEADISECSSKWYSHGTSCSSPDYRMRATVKCSDNRVRLVGGVNDYRGRVEFQFIGMWGTICDDHFDVNDAAVVCKEIGLDEKNATIYNGGAFGSYISSLIVDDLNCTGTELSIDKCSSYPWKANTFSCIYRHKSVGVNCRPNTPIKLVNGTSNYTGRLEVEYKGSYGTVCDREFDHEDAKVVCRMLGYNAMSVEVRKNSYFGEGTGNITISNLNCTGEESDLSECDTPHRWSKPYAYCDHGDDVSVECDTPVRLRGGRTDYDGQIEIYINGSWKNVCNQGFTQNDAQAICEMTRLRTQYNSTKPIAIHEAGFYEIKDITGASLTGIGCKGGEDDLYMCGSGKWTIATEKCIAQSVAINCRPETKVRLVNNSGEINVTGRTNTTVTGRIEVFYRNKWGTICDDQFDDSDAHVLCKMLNFTMGKVYREDDINSGNGNIYIDDLECLGTESDISECRSKEWGLHNCEHSEDVAITCDDIHNIDPCRPKEHTRLPNLELRYAKARTRGQAIDDSKLPLRWYNVGNNTMPKEPENNTMPKEDHCGTHFPVYSEDAVEKSVEDIVPIMAHQAGDIKAEYEILVKHCTDQGFYVYRLGPTINARSGYCFGIGTDEPPPTFSPEKVSTKINTVKEGISFHCKFTPSDDDLLYQVLWEIRGGYRATVSKQYYNRSRLLELDLNEKDFEEHDIGLGVNVSCSVRAYRTPNGAPGPLSLSSEPYFAGFKIRNPAISLRKGETKSIEIINTVPLVCLASFDKICFLQLEHMIPSDEKCSSKGSFSGRSCSTELRKDSFNNITTLDITTSETGQYGTYGQFQVNLVYNPNTELQYLMSQFWKRKYKLPTVNVEVFPEEDRSWRKTICSARNDPHMQTFDNKLYEHHHENKGEYILYRHGIFKNVEIQHKIASCVGTNSKAKCNCGVAVRAGGDVYVIDVCDENLEIGYKRCEDEALTVKKDNDFTYTIYLPYGTAVRARIDNQPWMGNEGGKIVDITILPSLHDNNGTSSGLCGTLNNNTDDDFKCRNGIPCAINDSTCFINSWKVAPNESLFDLLNVKNMTLERWSFSSCMCQRTNKANVPTSCDRSVTECTPGARTGEHSCGGLSSRRTRRSVSLNPVIPVVRQTSHYAIPNQHGIKKRDTTIWTKQEARQHCETYFHNMRTFNLCKKLPATHTNVSVENCILDIMLTNNTNWIAISRQSMQDTCTTELHRNASVREDARATITKNVSNTDQGNGFRVPVTASPVENEQIIELDDIENIVQEIKKLSCLNDCSNHGQCLNGVCQCDDGFGSTDCSLDMNKAPRLVGVLNDGFCDEKNTDCTHIYVFGEIFFGSNVTCRLQKFTFGINETSQIEGNLIEIKGTADTLVEAMCPIHQLRRKRSTNNDKPPEFTFGYNITVSNNGVNYSDETLTIYIYDSSCQFYENSPSKGINFHLKAGYCHIDGSCVSNGTIQQNVMCDTRVSKFGWSPVQTTTEAKTPESTTRSHGSSECSCSSEGTVRCNGASCLCKDGWTGSKCDTDIDECRTKDVCATKNHSGCENIPGGYKCLCLRHFKQTDEGKCEEQEDSKPEDTVNEIVAAKTDRQSFQLRIHIDIVLNSSQNLAVAETYQHFVEMTKNALVHHYTERLGISFVGVVIISLKSGSLIVDHVVIVKTDDFSLKAMSVAVADFSLGAKLSISGDEYSVSDVVIEKSQVGKEADHFQKYLLCESYTVIHPCKEHESCVLEKDAPVCKPTLTGESPTEKSQLVIIVSSSVGVVLLIVISILVCVACRGRQKNKDRLENHRQTTKHNDYHHMSTNEMTEIPRPKMCAGSKLGSRETALDNPSFEHDEYESLGSQSTHGDELRPNYESRDGHVYYFGKK